MVLLNMDVTSAAELSIAQLATGDATTTTQTFAIIVINRKKDGSRQKPSRIKQAQAESRATQSLKTET